MTRLNQILNHRILTCTLVFTTCICITTTTQAQFGFDISRLRNSKSSMRGGNSSNLQQVLPHVIRTVETLQQSRNQDRFRNRYQPAPNRPKQCPLPPPPVNVSPVTPPSVAPPPVAPPSVVPPPAAGNVPDVAETKVSLARSLVERAKRDFANQDYERTTDTLTEVIKLVPEDGDAFQFRSLAYFAQQDFERAAADVYDSFRFGNAWTWETVVTFYPNGKSSRYTNELRNLEQVNRSGEQSLSSHFLLAYQYIMLGHLPQAERELNKVLTVNPEEPLSQQLLAVVKDAQQTKKLSQK